MAHVILSHRVRDYDAWKPHYDGDVARREAAGMKEVKVGCPAGDDTMVYMIWEAQDTSVLDKMLNDPDLKAKMEEAGVVEAPTFVVIP